MTTIKHGLILMTGLPPTRGHEYLIDFASHHLHNFNRLGQLFVILCSRDREPLAGVDRVDALVEAFNHNVRGRMLGTGNVQILHLHGDVPQEPSEDANFWTIWRDLIFERINDWAQRVGKPNFDASSGFVYASDHYGKDLASAIGYEFVPCNTYREVVPISATRIRHDPIRFFDQIMPEFQSNLRRVITIFGPESTGKTTMAKLLSTNLNGYFVPEWAREYMEVMKLGTITDDLMWQVCWGQAAAEAAVRDKRDKPFIFQDTDLLSTIGYYRIWGHSPPDWILRKFEHGGHRADLYVLMNDQIPFTPDPLRLGGDRRESDNQFWIRLLKEFGCKYHIVHSVYRERQEDEITTVVRNEFLNNANGLGMFVRSSQENVMDRYK